MKNMLNKILKKTVMSVFNSYNNWIAVLWNILRDLTIELNILKLDKISISSFTTITIDNLMAMY